jgi:hypothetical protein
MGAHWQYMSCIERKALQGFACFLLSRSQVNEQRTMLTARWFDSHLQERGLFHNLFVLAEAGLYFYSRAVDQDPH